MPTVDTPRKGPKLFAITMDQRGSRSNADIVKEGLRRYNRVYAKGLERRFERSAGDEMQGLVSDPASAVDIVLDAISSQEWWIGVGVGVVEQPAPKSVRESSGPALEYARLAVDRAKRRKRGHGVTVAGDDPRVQDLQTVFTLIAVIIERQSPEALEAERLIQKGLTQADAAKQLGITPQSFADRLTRGSVTEKELGRELAVRIATSLVGP